jgi:hypothetical protein
VDTHGEELVTALDGPSVALGLVAACDEGLRAGGGAGDGSEPDEEVDEGGCANEHFDDIRWSWKMC